jgi:Domain of unknown function (DUF6391)
MKTTLRHMARRLRQHHGIEHATVTLLSRRLPGTFIAARSDLQGFIVYGDVDALTLREAAEEAISRLQQGERQLAVHQNCGTNLVVSGSLSGSAAWLLSSGRKRSWWDRLASAILGATLALMISPPIARWAQENITTSPEIADLRVRDVVRLDRGPVTQHRVVIV